MKKISLKISTVIFDMDGVITNTMPDHYKAWKQILSTEGIKISRFEVYCREGQPGINSVFELYADKGISITPKKAKDILWKKENLFKKIVKIRFIPGARSFLKYLYSNRFTLALVTGTARHELHKILPKDLYDLFTVVITGSDVKKGKPDPEPYLLALERLKASPREIVVIENAPFGIQSAKAAGLKCLAVKTSLPKEHLSNANYIFNSLADLRKKVVFKNSKHST